MGRHNKFDELSSYLLFRVFPMVPVIIIVILLSLHFRDHSFSAPLRDLTDRFSFLRQGIIEKKFCYIKNSKGNIQFVFGSKNRMQIDDFIGYYNCIGSDIECDELLNNQDLKYYPLEEEDIYSVIEYSKDSLYAKIMWENEYGSSMYFVPTITLHDSLPISEYISK